MFPKDLTDHATAILQLARQHKVKIASAESCTGGLIAACFTEIAGSSDVFERGYVTYSNDAKIEILGVAENMIAEHGAVSESVARAMAEGALERSHAAIAVSVTGVAGPGGGTLAKPVGLVHFACAVSNKTTQHKECRFGDLGRSAVRLESVITALDLIETGLSL